MPFRRENRLTTLGYLALAVVMVAVASFWVWSLLQPVERSWWESEW
jgi:hypothetical protein